MTLPDIETAFTALRPVLRQLEEKYPGWTLAQIVEHHRQSKLDEMFAAEPLPPYVPQPIPLGRFMERIESARSKQHEAGNHKDCRHEC